MAWSINNIENQISKTEGSYVLTYSIDGVTTIQKHEMSVNNGIDYKEIIPVGNTTGFSVNIEMTSSERKCYIRCTDTEGVSHTSNMFTIQYVNPAANNPPVISNITVLNVNESGVYNLEYIATDKDKDDTLTHYIKIDSEEYIQINPVLTAGNKFKYIGSQLSVGTHLCQLKVSDGKTDTESIIFQIIVPNLTNTPPSLSNIEVSNINSSGMYKLSYTVTDVDITDNLSHKLKIDEGEFLKITPISIGNNYFYNGNGLSEGTHKCILNISDGVNEINSEEFAIEIPKKEVSTIKEDLFNSKTEYDNSYTGIIDTIKQVINDMQTVPDYEWETGNQLINEKFELYTNASVKFKEVSQKAIDIIGDKKTSDAKDSLDKEIGELSNALGSLDSTMNDAFKDGILTEAEKITIRQNLQRLSLERVDVEKQYNSLIDKFNSADLEYAQTGIIPPDYTGETPDEYPDKSWYLKLYNDFKASYSNYDTKYKNLITIIDYILKKEGILDSQDKAKMDSAFDEYSLAITEYSKMASETIEGIARNEADNNKNVVTIFKGEYKRTNEENSSRLTKIEQQTGEIPSLKEQVSEIKQTAEEISLEVSTKVDGSEVGSIIRQSSSDIVLGLNKYGSRGTWVTLVDGYVTFQNCYVSCEAITSLPGDDPIIYFFGDKNNARCALDATEQYNYGVGESIRLKWDDKNYVYVGTETFQVFMGSGSTNYRNVFVVTPNKITHNGTNLSKEGHTHTRISNSGSSFETFSYGQATIKAGSAQGHMISDGGAFRFRPNSNNSTDLGESTYRWRYIFTNNSVQTSDKKYKEDIKYLQNTQFYRQRSLNAIDTPISTPFSDFILYDFKPATYKYKTLDESSSEPVSVDPLKNQIGFIANDIYNTDVGKTFLYNVSETEGEEDIMFSPTGYTTVVAIALQEEIRKTQLLESRIEILEQEITALKGE